MRKFSILLAMITMLIYTNESFGQTTIMMKKEGGVFTVPCTVNGLRFRFIFDTGASDCSISITEALFMLKNGYLAAEDIIGSSYAQIANGDITENTKILLKKIEFAGLTLTNVTATVIHTASAPLLFGQSAMAKLGTFQLDPMNGTLTIMNSPNRSYDYSDKKTNSRTYNRPSVPDTSRASKYGLDDYYLKLPTYTGKVKVFTCAAIYDEPDKKSWQKGSACKGVVRILWKENLKWYYVTDGKTKGYFSVDMIKQKQ